MQQILSAVSVTLFSIFLMSFALAQPESSIPINRGLLYSGGLGDPLQINGEDPKIAIWISGIEAEKIYMQLAKQAAVNKASASDPLQSCMDQSSGKVKVLSRGNGAIRCELSPQGEFSCALGADLGKGKSSMGLIC